MLIVSGDVFNRNERYPKVMVVHLTSVSRAGGPFDWEVTAPKGTGGLSRASTVKCGEIYTLWKQQLGSPLGTLPKSVMQEVDRSLAIALGIPGHRAEP
jgi:mRNA-degrading endonuclease toxin of MazEF toxin-antitoxin module